MISAGFPCQEHNCLYANTQVSIKILSADKISILTCIFNNAEICQLDKNSIAAANRHNLVHAISFGLNSYSCPQVV